MANITRLIVALSLVMSMTVLMHAAHAKTIQPGETRWVTGKVTAVDATHNAVVVDVPLEKKTVTVGVTLTDSAKLVGLQRLGDLKTGVKVSLHYTRKDGKLLGMELWLRGR